MATRLEITAYFDESGHSDDPALHFAGMAGFVAPFAVWEIVGKLWKRVTEGEPFCLKKPFHMKEFAHFEGEFKGWTEEKRRALFQKLIAIILVGQPTPVGAVVSVDDFNSLSESQRSAFRDPYHISFQMCTRGAAVCALGFEPEKVAMTYSYNREYGATKPQEVFSIDQAGGAEKLWRAMQQMTDYGEWMGTYDSRCPGEVVQLQAADLFAYELIKEFETLKTKPDRPMRWGLRQILTLADETYSLIRLLDRKEMLRTVLQSRFPCQRGVEEVSDPDAQMLLAQRATADWISARARTN